MYQLTNERVTVTTQCNQLGISTWRALVRLHVVKIYSITQRPRDDLLFVEGTLRCFSYKTDSRSIEKSSVKKKFFFIKTNLQKK